MSKGWLVIKELIKCIGRAIQPPSPLSVFVCGIEPFMPDKVLTSRSGFFHTAKDSSIDNPQSLLFGKVDLLFNIGFVMSLAALIFTFSSISGEKEAGTLRLMIANSIPRGQILLYKVIGKYVTLMIPFVASLLIALIILNTSPVISIVSSQLYPSFLVILLVTFLYILAMINLGVLISTLTHKSITSNVVSLLFWVVFIIAVPKISPMIAEIVYPIQSRNVVEMRKRVLKEGLIGELEQRKLQLSDAAMSKFGLSGSNDTVFDLEEDPKEIRAKVWYDNQVTALGDEYGKRIANELMKIEQDYRNKANVQTFITMSLSRVSPASCYTYLVSELSGTGVMERDNFIDNARRFQEKAEKTIYDKFEVETLGDRTSVGVTGELAESEVSPPEMDYRHASLAEVLQAEWLDILLLFLFNILFFVAAFLRFNRYDVR
jgi:ABC-type transport system involved in multi-copper enzyme maturation permease subunit